MPKKKIASDATPEKKPKVGTRDVTTLRLEAATLSIDAAGGSLSSFQLGTLNPLSWDSAVHDQLDVSALGPRPLGHFLCLDRWGPPSKEEERQGMPYHGEATAQEWQLSLRGPAAATLTAELPMAGLQVQRSVDLLQCSARASWSFETRAAVARIRDEVKNINKLGILNMVQHPSIAPPFLTSETRVDCNGKRGFTQAPRGCADVLWDAQREFPVAVTAAGVRDARCMTGGVDDVFSYEVNQSDAYGWVSAFTPSHGLLCYLWPRSDYPWVSLWCSSVNGGPPRARGLEFGTTGLHQPFPILTRHPRIFGLPTFEHLDSMETFKKSFCCFLLEIPSDFCGVQSIAVEKGAATTLRLSEKGSERKFEVTVASSEFL